jgi:hypothetical protein
MDFPGSLWLVQHTPAYENWQYAICYTDTNEQDKDLVTQPIMNKNYFVDEYYLKEIFPPHISQKNPVNKQWTTKNPSFQFY